MTATSVAALAITLRAFGLERAWLVPVTVGMVAIDPVRETLMFGQVNLVLMALISYDLLVLRGRWSGFLVGIAAGHQADPLGLRGAARHGRPPRRRAAGGQRVRGDRAGRGGAAPGRRGGVLDPALWDAGRVGGIEYIRNQSLNGALTRLLHHQPSTLLWLCVAAPVGAALLGLATLWWRRGDHRLGVLLAAGAMLMCSPISWDHHFVWAAPLLLVLRRRAPVLAVAAAALLLVGLRPLVAHGEKTELAWTALQQVPGNGYTWLVLALAAGAAYALRAGSIRPATSPSASRPPVVLGAE